MIDSSEDLNVRRGGGRLRRNVNIIEEDIDSRRLVRRTRRVQEESKINGIRSRTRLRNTEDSSESESVQ